MYDVAQHDTIQLQSWKNCVWVERKSLAGSHVFDHMTLISFIIKPIVYGVARLLFGVALSDSVTQ